MKALKLLAARFPQKLPQTKEALEQFSTELLDTYSLPQDRTFHHAIAETIMRMVAKKAGHYRTHYSKHFFATTVIKRMANEAAFARLKQFRDEEKLEETQQKEALQDGQGSPQESSSGVVQEA